MRIGLSIIGVVATATALSQGKPAFAEPLDLPTVPALSKITPLPNEPSNNTVPNEPSNNTASKISQPTSKRIAPVSRGVEESAPSVGPNEPSRPQGTERK